MSGFRKTLLKVMFCMAILVAYMSRSAYKEVQHAESNKAANLPRATANTIKPEQLSVHDEYSSYSKILPIGDGYIIGGFHVDNGSYYNELIIAKYSHDAKLEWRTRNTLLGIEYITGMIEISDGYIIVGYTVDNHENAYASGYMFKVSKSGELLWTKDISRLGKSTFIYGTALLDDGFVVSGYIEARGNTIHANTFLAKYDADGNEQWFKRQVGYFYEISNNGRNLITTGAVDYREEYLFAAITMDNSGHVLSTTEFGFQDDIEGYGYLQSFANEYFVYFGELDEDGYIAMIGKDGQKEWDAVIHEDDMQMSINAVTVIEDRLIFVGWAYDDYSDYGLIGRVDMDGKNISYTLIDDRGICSFYDVAPSYSGVVVAGHVIDYNDDVFGVVAIFNTDDL